MQMMYCVIQYIKDTHRKCPRTYGWVTHFNLFEQPGKSYRYVLVLEYRIHYAIIYKLFNCFSILL